MEPREALGRALARANDLDPDCPRAEERWDPAIPAWEYEADTFGDAVLGVLSTLGWELRPVQALGALPEDVK